MPLVYVFNASSQKVRLSINNPQQPSAMMQATQKPYIPFSIQIARSNDKTSNGTFINNYANSITVQTQNLQSNSVTLNVPADSTSTVDLWLYVFVNIMILFDTKGAIMDQQLIDWEISQSDTKSELCVQLIEKKVIGRSRHK